MKNKGGYVVLQISIFLGLLAFIGLIIFEIEIDKKKFIDASIHKGDTIEKIERKVYESIRDFQEEVLKEEIVEEELIKKYYFKQYQGFNINISYDKDKNLFRANAIKSNQKICIVYYDYEVKIFEDSGIINVIEFYEV